MVDYIINRIEDIFNTVVSAGSGNLILSPETFNATIYNGVITIMKNAVMPVAYVLLGLLFILELYNITIRTEGTQGTMGIEIPFRTMFKLVLCKVAIDSTELILGAIYSVSSQLIYNIGTTINGGNTLTPADMAIIRTTVGNMDFGVTLMTSVEVTLIYLIVQFVMVVVSVIVVGRMIEFYVLMAVAPVPLATFPNAEMSGIAKNFLKSFAAVCLQGVLIYVVVTLFPLLFGNAAMGDISDPSQFSKSLMTAAGYSFVLLISVFATGKWAKSICNAM
ncbi:MAG: CD0415/CD1112 family protein [Oscillospiraceae bacterium]